jgi:uncharacterized membrane protein
MNIQRMARHLVMTQWRLRRAFPESCLSAIEQAIRRAEAAHGGEICFALEGDLHPAQLMRDMSVRERALEVFSSMRVWDTEQNNGLLIYVLFADHAVEIIADRALHAVAGDQAWQRTAALMQECFSRGAFEEGALRGVRAATEELARHFPVRGSTPNELPDRPAVL